MAEQRRPLPPLLLDSAAPFHLVLGPDLRVLQAGPSIERIHPDGVVGSTLSDLFQVTTPKVSNDFEELAAQPRALFLLASVTRPGLVLRGQMLHDRDNGLLYFVGSPWVTQTASFTSLGLTLDDFAVSDAVVDYVLLLQSQSSSLTEARELAARLNETAEQLTHQAFHDALTGLPNRSLLLDHLRRTLDAPDGKDRQVAVLMLDLDGFKAVNDSYGHSAGDDVLRVVGDRLRAVARSQDLVARFGGDEFALVMDAGTTGSTFDDRTVAAVA